MSRGPIEQRTVGVPRMAPIVNIFAALAHPGGGFAGVHRPKTVPSECCAELTTSM